MNRSRTAALAAALLVPAALLTTTTASATAAPGAPTTRPGPDTRPPSALDQPGIYSFSNSRSDAPDDIRIYDTSGRNAPEATLRKTDLASVDYKANIGRKRILVTYEVPSVHKAAGVNQIFTTNYFIPPAASAPKADKPVNVVMVAALTARPAMKTGPDYRRSVSVFSEATGTNACPGAEVKVKRSGPNSKTGNDRVVFIVPNACLGVKAITQGTKAVSYSLVERDGIVAARDDVRRISVVPRI